MLAQGDGRITRKPAGCHTTRPPCRWTLQMTRKVYSGKSGSENSSTDEHRCGALELEYPADNGLYTTLFGRYEPEIADAVVAAPEVRRLVELEYNCRRVEALLDALDVVDREHRREVTKGRRLITDALWTVSDAIAEQARPCGTR